MAREHQRIFEIPISVVVEVVVCVAGYSVITHEEQQFIGRSYSIAIQVIGTVVLASHVADRGHDQYDGHDEFDSVYCAWIGEKGHGETGV